MPVPDIHPAGSSAGGGSQAAGSFVFPASYAQARLWFLDQYLAEPAIYNVPQALRLEGPLQVPALQESLRRVAQRQESLRTTFRQEGGEPRQRVAAQLDIELPVVDLAPLPADERELRLRELCSEEAFRPFDLAVGPLVRATLFHLSAEEHVLLLCLHHIIADGWSMAVLFRELKAFYRAILEGGEARVPDLPVQVADYALWQRDLLQGAGLERQQAYWKRQLEGAPPLLDLPTDRARPAAPSHRGAVERLALPPRLHADLNALARGEGATLFMALLAGYQILLARLCGQEDVVVGSPIAGRMRPEVEPLIGFFVNMLALRTDLSGNPTVREALGRVRKVALGAFEHQDLPFEKLVEALNPPRSRNHAPLFQTVFVLQPDPRPDDFFLGLRERPESLERRYAVFDLGLSVWEAEGGLQAELEYATDLFDAATAQRLLARFQRVLEAMAGDPGQRILDLPLLSGAEERQLLVEWNDTEVPLPLASVHELFEAQVELAPQAVALVLGARTLSYRALNHRANQVARLLLAHGLKPGMKAGLLMDRSFELVAGILAILKCGAAYVPLDPSHPHAQLGFVIADTGLAFLLTQERLLARLPECEARVFCLDLDRLPEPGADAVNPQVRVGPEDLAYLMYTSGSSGKPKGVEILHRGIVRLICGGDFARLDADTRVLQLAPVAFDAATFELWGPLLHGGRCVLYPEPDLSFATLRDVLARDRIDTLWLTSSLFNSIIDHAPDLLAPVRQLLIGGEALSVRHVRRALALLPGTRIINGYGPTEGTTFTCCYPIPAILDPGLRSIPIGRPIGNTRVYLLDPRGRPVPVGVAGELHVGGLGLARGYVNLPGLTAEKFIPDPFGTAPGGRLYRTGDLARHLPDGNLEFLGRKDGQVKIRGHRIEFGEVEAALGEYPGMRQAVVDTRTDATGDLKIVAYLEAPDPAGGPFSLEGLAEFLKSRLPPYMVPAAFGVVPALPLKNGKPDRLALRNVRLVGPNPDVREGPGDPTQQLLAQIWEEFLEVRPIGIQDDFFELGGHSLLALAMLERLEQVFGRRLPVSSFYARTTIQSLSRLLLETPQGQAESPILALRAGDGRTPFFFLHGDFNGGGFYCRDLAANLDPAQPFFAVHPYGLGGQPPPTRMESMAAEHLKLIRSVQPQGPYRLGGHCNGALEAYEMAQQLRAAGEAVDLLVMLDPPDPNVDAAPAGPPPFTLPADQDALSPEERRLALLGRYFLVVSAYRPRPYAGTLTLFRSEEEGFSAVPGAEPWARLAGGHRVVRLQGDHRSSLTRHAADLGRQLQRCLDQADPGRVPAPSLQGPS